MSLRVLAILRGQSQEAETTQPSPHMFVELTCDKGRENMQGEREEGRRGGEKKRGNAGRETEERGQREGKTALHMTRRMCLV